MSRVIHFHSCGGPEVLRIEEDHVAAPTAGEIRVRIEAIGLNRAEAAFRSGHYLESAQFPSRLGYEASGVVEALGEGVVGFTPGEAVCVIPAFSMTRYGVYAELANVPASAVLRRPPDLSATAAAALWMAYLTAYGALIDIAQLGKGDHVVITAPSSSVGLAAIQLANFVGAVPIAITRSPHKRDALLAAGARHVIAHETPSATIAQVMQASGDGGVRLVFDSVAGPEVKTLAAMLAPRGTLIVYGNLSGAGDSTPFPFREAVGKGLSLRGYLVFELIRDAQRLRAAEAFIRDALRRKAIQPTISRIFPFAEIIQAHRYLESNQQLGKVIVEIPPQQIH
ncbi:MAG TPA: zinc-dependent alcohol dehydrogenase family protein [Rhodocyclaceae bacterium]|nr:zinc-dependent alcohol dehydrogenase family protein [Rhodocyclaceae bacterium]